MLVAPILSPATIARTTGAVALVYKGAISDFSRRLKKTAFASEFLASPSKVVRSASATGRLS